MMLVIICFVPESPRWLLMQGKVDKARDIVMKLHSIEGEDDQEFARSEFYQMHKQVELDITLNPSWVKRYLLLERASLTITSARVIPPPKLSQTRYPRDGIRLRRTVYCCACHQQLRSYSICCSRLRDQRPACPAMWMDHSRYSLQRRWCCNHGVFSCIPRPYRCKR